METTDKSMLHFKSDIQLVMFKKQIHLKNKILSTKTLEPIKQEQKTAC